MLKTQGFQRISAEQYIRDAHFYANRSLLRSRISSLINTTVKEKTACSKVDVVAHSMGGCITKGSENGQSFVDPGLLRRVVTVGTPHQGSSLADHLWRYVDDAAHDEGEQNFATFLYLTGHSATGGAIEDLQTTSPGIAADIPGVECYEIIGHSDPEGGELAKSIWHVLEFLYFLANPTSYPPFPGLPTVHDFLFRGDGSDWVVSLDSQRGGGSKARMIEVPWHCDEGQDADFITLVQPCLQGGGLSKVESLSPVTSSPSCQEVLPPMSLPHAVGTIHIIEPLNGSMVDAGSTLKVRLEGTGATNGAVVALEDSDSQILDSLSNETTLIVPTDARGTLHLAALGINLETRAVTSSDSIILMISSNASLEEIHPGSPDSLALELVPQLPVQRSVMLTILGLYSDGIYADLTHTNLGTTYVSSDTSIVDTTNNGLLTPVHEGQAFVHAYNSGRECTIAVTVYTLTGISDTALNFEPDGIINDSDLKILLTTIQKGDMRADLNADGDLDAKDIFVFSKRWSSFVC